MVRRRRQALGNLDEVEVDTISIFLFVPLKYTFWKMYVYKLHQCVTCHFKNDYECMNQTLLECRHFLTRISTHHVCVPQSKCACICIYAFVCVWAGWGVQGKRKWFFKWCVLRDIVKSTLPGGQEHLIVQQAMIALREGNRKRKRERNKKTESGKEIN